MYNLINYDITHPIGLPEQQDHSYYTAPSAEDKNTFSKTLMIFDSLSTEANTHTCNKTTTLGYQATFI